MHGPHTRTDPLCMRILNACQLLALFIHNWTWIPLIVGRARCYGLDPIISRTGFFKPMASNAYWSYRKVNHKVGATHPRGQGPHRHGQELRLLRERPEWSPNGRQALRPLPEPHLPSRGLDAHLQL